MKRSNQPVWGAMTGALTTDDGFSSNKHSSNIAWKNKGGRNATTEESRHGGGGALAKVKSAPKGASLQRLPVQHPTANQVGSKVGKSAANTGAVATKQPNRKGGAAFYGE